MVISVIIPTFQPKSYLKDCLYSLNKQSLSHELFEILIVLNGRREPYEEQIRQYISSYPTLSCRLIYCEKNGVSNARNKGLDEAIGEYICFIDDDDMVTESYLDELLAKASEKTIALSNTFAFNDGSNQYLPIYISSEFKQNKCNIPLTSIRRNMYVVWGKLIHRTIINKRRFDISLMNGEDAQFMLKISDRISQFSFTSENAQYHYRQRSSSAFNQRRPTSYHMKNMIIRILKAVQIYFSNPKVYNLHVFFTYICATLFGGIRQILHIKQL